MRKTTITMALAALLVMALAVPAFAYTLNADGTGFVGKGEVQTAFGWNNPTLQRNAQGVSFEAVTVTERSWVCDRDAGPQIQERERTTTTTSVLDEETRDRNQVTGFNLLGFDSSTSTTDGPAPGSCPTGWTAGPISDPELVSSELYALFNGQRVLLP